MKGGSKQIPIEIEMRSTSVTGLWWRISYQRQGRQYFQLGRNLIIAVK